MLYIATRYFYHPVRIPKVSNPMKAGPEPREARGEAFLVAVHYETPRKAQGSSLKLHTILGEIVINVKICVTQECNGGGCGDVSYVPRPGLASDGNT